MTEFSNTESRVGDAEIGKIDVVHSDEDVVVLNKPSGLLVHPGRESVDRVTCLSVMREQTGRWVYPVHRLDRQTSGLLVMAFSSEMAAVLSQAFREGEVEKKYLAVVRGFLEESVLVERPLKRPDNPDRIDEAETAIAPLGRATIDVAVGRFPEGRYSLVEAVPRTGRRHQIRRHLAGLSRPIIGDTVYGDGRHNRLFRERYGLHRLLLHYKKHQLLLM